MAHGRRTPGWILPAAGRSSVALAINIDSHLDAATWNWAGEDQFVRAPQDLPALCTHLALVKRRGMPVLATHSEEIACILRTSVYAGRCVLLLRRGSRPAH